MACFGLGYQINMFGCEDPTAGLVSSVLGTAPISVSTVAGVATVSHNDSGVTPGTYNYGGFTVDAKGHITAATFAPVPMYNLTVQDEGVLVDTTQTMNFTGVGVTVTDVAGVATVNIPGASSGPIWQPLTQGAYYGYDGSSVNTTAMGYNVHVDPAAGSSVLVGLDGYLRANADLAVGIGYVADCGNSEDIAIGANAVTGNDAGTRRTAIGSLVSITTSDSATGVGSRLSCATSANTCLYGASASSSNSPTAVGIGRGLSLTNATNAAVVGQGTAVTAVDSSGIGQGQTIANSNCVALGKAASTTANDELCTGSQTRLRFPSLTAAAASTATSPTTFGMIWDNSTKVCVPNTMPTSGLVAITPTLTGITNATVQGRMARSGNVLIWQVYILISGTTVVSANPTISNPKAWNSSTDHKWVGSGMVTTAADGVVPITILPASTSTCQAYYHKTGVATTTLADIGDGTLTFANGDKIQFSCYYQTSTA